MAGSAAGRKASAFLSALLLFGLAAGAYATSCVRKEPAVPGDAGGGSPEAITVKSLRAIGEGAFPKWSPDGEAVAFTREREDPGDPQGITYDVYVSRPDGSGARCLTAGNPALAGTGWKGQPSWHPCGEYLVFTAENAGYPRKGTGATARPGIGRNHNVWIMTRDGSRFWRITDYPENWGVIRPSFSHDGRTLYWNEEFSMEKYPHGKPSDPDEDPRAPGLQGHPGSYWGWENVWYRQGEELGAWRVKLADISFEGGEPKISNIRAVDPPEGFTLIEGTGFIPGDGALAGSFTDLEENGGQGFWGDIYVCDLGGSLLRRLTDTPFVHDENPEFSPDGGKIAWCAAQGYPGDGEELWMMDADGGNKTRLTFFTDPEHEEYDPHARQITEATWSPDGKRVIFGHVSQEERGGIHVPSTLYLLVLD
ncbi:MAG: PD40 domain-containing protein [Actinobacteria bacterium]|nr:PD40 domain-containing protein [Actinomycetota bacterium]